MLQGGLIAEVSFGLGLRLTPLFGGLPEQSDIEQVRDEAEGLGEYFLDTLWSDILSLRISGGIHAVHNGYHRLLSRRFPYAVYDRVESEVARVRAVLDCRRDPEWIAKKLK